MNLQELQKQIVSKNIQSVYVFTGEEVGIMDIYIQKIAEGKETKRVDSISVIYKRLQNHSFSSKPTCYIIRDDKEYQQQEKLWGTLGRMLKDDIIIFVYTNIDKRLRFYKQHVEEIVDFEKLPMDTLRKYLQKEVALSKESAETLVEICDFDYSRILLECDKIRQFSNIPTNAMLSLEQIFHILLEDKVFHQSPKDAIFDLIDAICKRQIKKSFDLWHQLRQVDNNPMGVISLVYNNLRGMLLVRSCDKGDDVCATTGLTGFQVKLAKEKGNKYTVGELTAALQRLREAEKGIKTGLIEQDMAIDFVLVGIL